jgi:hypothetical protein
MNRFQTSLSISTCAATSWKGEEGEEAEEAEAEAAAVAAARPAQDELRRERV